MGEYEMEIRPTTCIVYSYFTIKLIVITVLMGILYHIPRGYCCITDEAEIAAMQPHNAQSIFTPLNNDGSVDFLQVCVFGLNLQDERRHITVDHDIF